MENSFLNSNGQLFLSKVEVDTNEEMWYNMVNGEYGGVTMAEKQPSVSIYNQIVKAYDECPSVQAISLVLGVSKMTVQRVLITEGLWESKRSREIVDLAKQGKTAEQIATELYLSLKCVQNYMPYKRGMRQECVTANAKIAKQKRERMRIALEGQRGKFASPSITDRIQMDENIRRVNVPYVWRAEEGRYVAL